jgi:manganese/zinc/iron transport system permease protein
MSAAFEIQLIAALVAVACALPGVFLVLRRMAMVSDAITHTVLLGIVTGFFLTRNLESPILLVCASLTGVFTVWLTELVYKSKLISEDASIGIVFPLLFSIAIILITRYAGNVHLDTDSVLLGELAFAPFDRLYVMGRDIGAKSIYVSFALVVINLVFILLFYKELQLATFDANLAAALGFAPGFIHYLLMGLVSFTTVGAFEAVGSILVVAFMIGPPVTAYLMTDNLKKMIVLSAVIGLFNAISGYHLATWKDVSIAGCMAVMTGFTFLIVFLFVPRRGLIGVLICRYKQRYIFAEKTLMFHLWHHEGTPKEEEEALYKTIRLHMHWDKKFAARVVKKLISDGRVTLEGNLLKLSEKGRQESRRDRRELLG